MLSACQTYVAIFFGFLLHGCAIDVKEDTLAQREVLVYLYHSVCHTPCIYYSYKFYDHGNWHLLNSGQACGKV